HRPKSDFTKTVVAVHGAPGNHANFKQLIEHYRGSKTRVIVPNLPDFSHTRSTNGVFWHTTPERVTFLKDFLGNLQVDRIDCLVAHSFGIQTIGALWNEV